MEDKNAGIKSELSPRMTVCGVMLAALHVCWLNTQHATLGLETWLGFHFLFL